MNCLRPHCSGYIIDDGDGGKVCNLCGRPYVNGKMNPQRIDQAVRQKQGLTKPLESYEPGMTREEFFQFLEKACRPLKETQEKEIAIDRRKGPQKAKLEDSLLYGIYLAEKKLKNFGEEK